MTKEEFIEKIRNEEIEMVSWGRRLANFVIDIILFRIISILLIILFASMDSTLMSGVNEFSVYVIGLFILFFYYFLFEAIFQRTPAKFITGTKVVMMDGSKPSTSTIAKRALSRFVPFEPLSGSNGTWWHDRWTKTRVVKASSTARIEIQKERELGSKLEYICGECGTDVSADAMVCPKCGADLSKIEEV